MSDKPQNSKATDEIEHQTTTSPDIEVSKENNLLSPEDGTGSKKGRGLLQVPSRSSSQRNQSSPTSTGLSGATVNDSRNSIGGRSKDSKASFLGRQRNGSASSNRTGGDTEPSNTPVNSSPTSPVATTQKKKKSGGLFSLFGCCVAPDNANNVEENTENVHKLDKLPQRPATARSRTHTPQEQPKVTTEKEAQPPPTTQEGKDQRVSSGSTHDEVTVTEQETRDSKQTIPPAVTVEPPTAQSSNDQAQLTVQPTESGDIEMRDAPAEEAEQVPVAATTQESATSNLPPPPPGPGPAPATAPGPITEPGPSAGPLYEPQKWLLPPLAPELKGKKCLVLDLDETLVHSSFKVCTVDIGYSEHVLMMTITDFASGRLHNPRRNRG